MQDLIAFSISTHTERAAVYTESAGAYTESNKALCGKRVWAMTDYVRGATLFQTIFTMYNIIAYSLCRAAPLFYIFTTKVTIESSIMGTSF